MVARRPRYLLPARARRQQGFIYMALIVFFGVLTVAAGAAMLSGAMLQRRTSEEQLIFVGGEFRNAIESYYQASAAAQPGAPRFPPRLEDLLADPRQKTLVRHLRQIYPDPLTGRAEWGTVQAPDGGVMGVYSLSPATAVKRFGFPPEFKYLEGKTKISQWQFIYVPPVIPVLPAAPEAAAPATTPAAPAAPGTAADTQLPDLQKLQDLQIQIPDEAAPAP
jgi:type II secretory pathway pseudopilin PulG